MNLYIHQSVAKYNYIKWATYMIMNGKELIFKTLKNEVVERVPWIPYTGIHVASLNNISAETLLKDEKLLFQSLMEAHKQYTPDGMPVIFDLQLEAEILGCELMWDDKAPPSVRTHPLSEDKVIDLKLPAKEEGRLPIVLNVMKRMKKEVGDTTALYGLICGPLTLASHLRGMNLFMDMYEDEVFVQKIIEFSTEVFLRMSDFYIEAGMDVIAAVDPIVSQISTETFEIFLHEPYTKIFNYLRERKVYGGLFVCGDATKNMESMCKTNPDAISIDENIDIAAVKKITDSYNIVISGNIPLTTVMLHGTQQDNQKYAVNLIEKLGRKNFILALGCDMPYDVPPVNIIGISQAVQDPEATALFLKGYHKEILDIDVKMPDYLNLGRPLIEVFTIDSATCAACGYMKMAALEMKKIFDGKIDIVERKITERENVVRLGKIGIKNLPALIINGEPKFISIIPNRNELRKVIEMYL